MSKRKAQKGMLISQEIIGTSFTAWIASNAKGTRTGWYSKREQAEKALREGYFAIPVAAPTKSFKGTTKLTFFISK